MTKMATVTLDDHSAAFLADQVAAGRFASESDAMAEALRLLEERDRALDELRAEIQKGEASGYPADIDFDDFVRDLKAKHLT
jgi:antitoxin ParD1/3/4